jgi:hypothetical protein
LECPYFEKDPRLDPAELPQPGWLFDLDLGLIDGNVVEHLGQLGFPNGNTFPNGHPIPFVTSVPMARLDWTVSPRFELGYRLPSGFGEVDVAYRFLLTAGSGSTTDPVAAPDATAALQSHLDVQVGDVDYASHETSLAAMLDGNWDMKWRIGLRTANVSFDSQADEPFAAAAAGSHIFERSIADDFWGIGPHAALELKKRRNSWGLGWEGRLDAGLLFGAVTQRFSEVSTTPGHGGAYDLSMWEQVPMISGFLGLDWRPPNRPNLDILLGYTAEYWWNVGRISDPDYYNGHSAAELGLNGPVLRLEYNY